MISGYLDGMQNSIPQEDETAIVLEIDHDQSLSRFD
jgi:hypothetical protein